MAEVSIELTLLAYETNELAKLFYSYLHTNRDARNRTLINGLKDRCFTVKLRRYFNFNTYMKKKLRNKLFWIETVNTEKKKIGNTPVKNTG